MNIIPGDDSMTFERVFRELYEETIRGGAKS